MSLWVIVSNQFGNNTDLSYQYPSNEQFIDYLKSVIENQKAQIESLANNNEERMTEFETRIQQMEQQNKSPLFGLKK